MKTNSRTGWLAACLILATARVWAADICTLKALPSAASLWDALTSAEIEDCVRNRTTGEMKRLKIDMPARNAAQHQARARQAWEDLSQQLDTQRAGLTGSMNDLFNDVQNRSQKALQSVEAIANQQSGPLAYRTAWEIDFDGELPKVLNPSGQLELAPALALEDRLSQACANEGVSCPEAARHAVVLMQDIALARAIGSFYGQLVIEGLAAKVADINAEWDRFLFNSKPMYPWDLWLTDVLNRRSTAYDQQSGFREAPSHQYFLLHPAPGFSFVQGAADGNELRPTVYMELFGVNRWRAKFLTGASAIVEYADRRDAADVGWGVLLTFANRFSFGLTAHGDEFGITLGLDLANFYKERLRPQIETIKERLP